MIQFNKKTNSSDNDSILKACDFMNQSVNEISHTLSTVIDQAILEGFKRKGITFKSLKHIEEVVRTRCHTEDFQEQKRRVYYLDGEAFLIHHYGVYTVVESDKETHGVTVSDGGFEFV